jgi:hypothetical protein
MAFGPKNFYYERVIPQLERYISKSSTADVGDPSFRDIAIECAGSLFHLRDHLVSIFGDKFTRYHVANLCPSYDLIGDIYNASKHAYLNRKGRLIDDYTSVLDGAFVSRFKDEHGVYSKNQTVVFVTPKGEPAIDVLKLCIEVYNFWTGLLRDRGLITDPEFMRYPGDDWHPRDLLTDSVSFDVKVHEKICHRDIKVVVRAYDNSSKTFVYG